MGVRIVSDSDTQELTPGISFRTVHGVGRVIPLASRAIHPASFIAASQL